MKRSGWIAVGYGVEPDGRCLRITLHSGSTSIARAERMIGRDVAAEFVAWFSADRQPAPPSFPSSSFLVDTFWHEDHHGEETGGDLCFTLPYDGEEHRVWLQGKLASGFVAAIKAALAEPVM